MGDAGCWLRLYIVQRTPGAERPDVRGALFRGDCTSTGTFNAFEYLGYRNGCGYRVRFTWPSSMELEKEPFEKARKLLQQIKLSP